MQNWASVQPTGKSQKCLEQPNGGAGIALNIKQQRDETSTMDLFITEWVTLSKESKQEDLKSCSEGAGMSLISAYLKKKSKGYGENHL